MVRFFGIVFLALIAEALVLVVNYYSKSTFLEDFIKNQSLQIMGTILALNVATSSFLVGHLTNIEITLRKKIFGKSKGEIKHNLMFMLVAFFLDLILLTGSPLVVEKSPQYLSYIKYTCTGVSLLLFILYLYSLYEMTTAIFSIDGIITEDSHEKP